MKEDVSIIAGMKRYPGSQEQGTRPCHIIQQTSHKRLIGRGKKKPRRVAAFALGKEQQRTEQKKEFIESSLGREVELFRVKLSRVDFKSRDQAFYSVGWGQSPAVRAVRSVLWVDPGSWRSSREGLTGDTFNIPCIYHFCSL